MSAGRIIFSSPLLAAAIAALAGGCEKKAATAEVPGERPPQREMNWQEQPLSGVSAQPASPIVVKEGKLPLLYLSERAESIRILDRTSNELLIEMNVRGRSYISLDEQSGIVIGKDRVVSGPLPAKHVYAVYVLPDGENFSRTGTYEPVRGRKSGTDTEDSNK